MLFSKRPLPDRCNLLVFTPSAHENTSFLGGKFVPTGTIALAALDGERSRTAAFAAARPVFAATAALSAGFRDSRLELTGTVASATWLLPFLSGTVAAEANLGRTFHDAASLADATCMDVLAGAMTGAAFQRTLSCSFAAETRAVIVDRTDQILSDRPWAVLISARPIACTLPKQKFEEASHHISFRIAMARRIKRGSAETKVAHATPATGLSEQHKARRSPDGERGTSAASLNPSVAVWREAVT